MDARESLRNLFPRVAFKRLTAVETREDRQHEYNGVASLRRIFGEATEVRKFKARFVYVSDEDTDCTSDAGTLTWYDSRTNQPNRAPEYRLYYTDNDAMNFAQAGDLLLICQEATEGKILVVVAPKNSSSEIQLHRLFRRDMFGEEGFSEQDVPGGVDVGAAESLVLERLGVDTTELGTRATWLDRLTDRFREAVAQARFPTTAEFSAFARDSIADETRGLTPDQKLRAWLDHEESLFRTLERYLVEEQVEKGFDDVDHFIRYSLSVHNRRKSRMGYSFENHLEKLFKESQLQYTRYAVTENRSRPDFIFPGQSAYDDPQFDEDLLVMLGAKSTCKDRWRQVLAEADRIRRKHLATLEMGISVNQFNEMTDQQVQLVVPSELHTSYLQQHQGQLLSVQEFIESVRQTQE